MKIQTVVVLSLVAMIAAAPRALVRRASDSDSSVDCGSGTPTGLGPLLTQLGTLLNNVLINVQQLQLIQSSSSGGLLGLPDILEQVRRLVITLLGGSGSTPSKNSGNEGAVASLIGQLTDALDDLLGPGTGESYACDGGDVGHLVGGLTGNMLDPLLVGILQLVGNLLDGLGLMR